MYPEFESALGGSVNLKELSSRLGLSPTTVSRALGGYPEVNAETRARVAEAAALYNYRPNKRARALATGKAFAIGHVVSMSNKDELVNPIFGDFIAGITETSATSGYSLSITLAESGAEEATFRKLKSEGSVDGIVLQSPRTDDHRIALMHEVGMPFVVHGRASDVEADYAWVDVNNRRAVARATAFLLDLGHRRIGLVNGEETMDFAARRRAGFADALAEAGITPDPALTFSGPMTEENGYAATRAMLARADRPTGLVLASIISAIGARRAIAEAGLTMGKDVSLIAYDDDLSYLSNRSDVPLVTAVRSSVRHAGAVIAKMLIAQIDDPTRAPETVLLEAELVVGQSTGPAP